MALYGPLFRAVASCDAPKLAELLASPDAAGLNLSVRCPEGRTMLHMAAEREGGAALVPLLAAAGADVDARSGDAAAETPLQVAAAHAPAAALALLRAGACAGADDAAKRNAERLASGGAEDEERRLREALAEALQAAL